MRGGLDAHGVEDLDEGAEFAVNRVPRHNGHDDEQRADVEDEDAVDHLIDRLGNGPLRIVGLARGYPDELDAPEGEHHENQGDEETVELSGEKAPAIEKVGEGGVGQMRIGIDARCNHVKAQNDHPDDGCDLDDGEPEFELAEGSHPDEVDGGDDKQHDGRRRPRRNRRKPVLNVLADHRQFGHRHSDVVKPVIPTGHKPRPRAPIVIGITAEGARARPMDRHLPHRAHHKENDGAAQSVGQKNRRAGQLDPLRRTVKQPRPNRPSQGDHLNVPIGQRSAKPAVVRSASPRRAAVAVRLCAHTVSPPPRAQASV